MEKAKSLKYGVFINAKDASYDSYKDMQLVCPCCNKPVFKTSEKYRPAHTRKAPKTKQLVCVKESEVRAAFAHFGEANEQCENYNKSISKKEIQQFEFTSRQQRIKKWESSFLDIVGYEKKMKNSLANKYRDRIRQAGGDISSKSLAEVFCRFQKGVHLMLEAFCNNGSKHEAFFKERFIERRSMKLQEKKICHDALLFIANGNSLHLFSCLIDCAVEKEKEIMHSFYDEAGDCFGEYLSINKIISDAVESLLLRNRLKSQKKPGQSIAEDCFRSSMDKLAVRVCMLLTMLIFSIKWWEN